MRHMNPNFWNGKRVLITGHSGFKGSWLSLWLSKLGSEICGFSLPDGRSEPNMYDECRVADHIALPAYGDIRDYDSLEKIYKQFRPEIVFHMAAQPLVRRSYVDPVLTFNTNVIGTTNLLDVARRFESAKCIVNITTDKVYNNKEWLWGYREDEPLGGADPYSASKACSELVTDSFRLSFFNKCNIPVATARSGNVIGGGDWSEDRIIPDIVRSLIKNKSLVLRNPNAIRPWQHVLEPLLGYITLAEKLYCGDCGDGTAYNFGPNQSDSKDVKWLVANFAKSWGEELRIELEGQEQPHEAKYLKLDSSKSLEYLGWKSSLTTEKAVELTAHWFKKWVDDRGALAEYSLYQINEYENILNIS